HRDFSDEMAQVVDTEVRAILDQAMDEAYKALTSNRTVLDQLAKELLEKETLDKEEVAEIFKKLKRRPNRPAWTGSNKRKPSKKGPVKAPVRLVKPEDTKASLEHPTDSPSTGGAVASEVKKSKK
ncbi:MAG: cell division protein FtsH, partial [Candidatus Nanopelagicales bacterium]